MSLEDRAKLNIQERSEELRLKKRIIKGKFNQRMINLYNTMAFTK